MHYRSFWHKRSAFTLIELLVVIAILAILAVVVIVTLNPSELLRQSRDSNRIADLSTLNSALSLYVSDQGGTASFSLGNASSVYVSAYDATISGGATSSPCTALGFSSLASGMSYQCVSAQNYRNVDGTGWIPVSFKSLSGGSPFGNLPVDPVNATSAGLYYVYNASSTQYEVTSLFESQKYKAQYAQSPMVPGYPSVNAKGSSLSISSFYNPTGLVGWWPLSEGSGTTAYDQSGNKMNGAWNGSSTNGSYYSGGKVTGYAGYFNGGTGCTGPGDCVSIPSSANLHPSTALTITAWVKKATGSLGSGIVVARSANDYFFDFANSATCLRFGINSSWSMQGCGYPDDGGWHFVAGAYDGTAIYRYVDGALLSGTSATTSAILNSGGTLSIGGYGASPALSGAVNDLRFYNRALSAAEISALYVAGK